ncbi:SAM-dependent methyltransferase [Actinopolyspora biskrensis]|uniref:SAM-dependent methyltransferase n=1 Tax=Actinopolyspora biskrensis TaxID=1470178 RepID=A0A852Z3R6_9ACTN|nr:methyltransferase domain-containing protein [Actinopolyspora biskrensis]NYH80642.1 SAM-dependent methyltransferase [Actinopolyspora biskrensis]
MADWSWNLDAASSEPLRSYEDVLVKRIFHPWACHLLGVLRPEPGSRAIDVATGPGTVARMLAASVGPRGSVLGTDISPGMLDLARAKPPVDGAAIEYAECGADSLRAPDAAYDVVVCQHGLQFFPDRRAALSELHRVAADGARLAISLWAGLESNPMFRALHDAVSAELGEQQAQDFRQPWSLPADEVVQLLHEVGFVDVRRTPAALPVHVPEGAEGLSCVYRLSAIAEELEQLHPTAHEALMQNLRTRLAPLLHDGTIHAVTSAEVVTATATSTRPA